MNMIKKENLGEWGAWKNLQRGGNGVYSGQTANIRSSENMVRKKKEGGRKRVPCGKSFGCPGHGNVAEMGGKNAGNADPCRHLTNWVLILQYRSRENVWKNP